MSQELLFELNERPEAKIDNTEIVQVLLYYEKAEAKDFKQLCKAGMKIEFPNEYIEKGNISDFLLKVLKKYYGENSAKTNL